MFPFIFPVSFLPPSICFTPGTPPHCPCSAYPNRRKEAGVLFVQVTILVYIF